jgi:hypothetical protein
MRGFQPKFTEGFSNQKRLGKPRIMDVTPKQTTNSRKAYREYLIVSRTNFKQKSP